MSSSDSESEDDKPEPNKTGKRKRITRKDVPFSMINFDIFQPHLDMTNPTLYEKYVYLIEKKKKKPTRYYLKFDVYDGGGSAGSSVLLLFEDTQSETPIHRVELSKKTEFGATIKEKAQFPYQFHIFSDGKSGKNKKHPITFCTQNKVEFSDWERIFTNSGFKNLSLHKIKKKKKRKLSLAFGGISDSNQEEAEDLPKVRSFLPEKTSLPAPTQKFSESLRSNYFPQIPLPAFPQAFVMKPVLLWTHKDVVEWSKVFIVTVKFITLFEMQGPSPKKLTITKMKNLDGKFLSEIVNSKDFPNFMKSLGFTALHDILVIKKSIRLLLFERYFNAGRTMAKEKAIQIHQKHQKKLTPAELNLWADRKRDLYDLRRIHKKINRMFGIEELLSSSSSPNSLGSSLSGSSLDLDLESRENEMRVIDEEIIDDVSFGLSNSKIGLIGKEEEEEEEEASEEVEKPMINDKDRSYRFRIKLIITENMQNETFKAIRRVMGVALKLSPSVPNSVKFGFFHVAVGIGSIQFDYNDSGIVSIRRTTSRNVILCLDVDNLIIEHDSLHGFTRELAKIILYWNVNHRYDAVSFNCQTFVNDLLVKLGILKGKKADFKFHEHAKKFLNRMKYKGKCDMKLKFTNQFIKAFTGKSEYFNPFIKRKKFKPKSHEELDEFMLNCLAVVPTFKMDFYSEYELLKGFDRAMWMRHFKCKDSEKFKKSKNGCPFNWDAKVQESYRDSLTDVSVGEEFGLSFTKSPSIRNKFD